MMREEKIHFHPSGPLIALVGNPNCGKTALFNRLTGSFQKVANYVGVTVERKEGRLVTSSHVALRILDLPGTYSLYPRSLDERVTCDVLAGRAQGEKRPDLAICVVDDHFQGCISRSILSYLAPRPPSESRSETHGATLARAQQHGPADAGQTLPDKSY